ncbi:MAG: rhodanese-like domain-containing protein [Coriobacteriales bacterium]|jgi:rhodanese-related sulfurtransferase|nr:rhodanese-like domain-containing protein [Coriobacteriales bacterium]
MDAASKISPEEALALLEREPAARLIDVRPAVAYLGGHIPGAKSLPIVQLAAAAVSALPDQTAPVVAYCQTGQQSPKACQILADLGYQEVYDLGGVESWPYPLQGGL